MWYVRPKGVCKTTSEFQPLQYFVDLFMCSTAAIRELSKVHHLCRAERREGRGAGPAGHDGSGGEPHCAGHGAHCDGEKTSDGQQLSAEISLGNWGASASRYPGSPAGCHSVDSSKGDCLPMIRHDSIEHAYVKALKHRSTVFSGGQAYYMQQPNAAERLTLG